ncbi:protein weak chloroplast movement under blue light 1 [Tanacetum coccineum]
MNLDEVLKSVWTAEGDLNAQPIDIQQGHKKSKMLSKLQAAFKDIEATRASGRLALGAMSALHETEDQANNWVSEAMSQIDLANESELKALNKLEEMNSDLASKKEQLSTAMQDAERALID